MASITYDILTDEENIDEVVATNKALATEFDRVLKEYIQILNRLSTEGLTKGDAAENLKSLATYVKTLEDEVSIVTDRINTYLQQYKSNMDEADSYLY